ncbi:HAD family hydrolase [Chitinimonas lacunae]|uniref:HAD family hydrolase n=1 Tax=Chitinimonas lacunae TaxID=1963018 RepID=A0ABV8MPC4_9NEIS
MTRLTLFDLDHTLLSGDSEMAWGEFLLARGHLDAAIHAERCADWQRQYREGTLDVPAYYAFQLSLLTPFRRHELEALRREYLSERVEPMLTRRSRALVAERLAAGDLVAIVTATHRFLTEPIAALFGVEHLLATEPEADAAGDFTGRLIGEPCLREGKIVHVDAWLARLGRRWEDFDQRWFYSDSVNDIPLLEKVDRPVAVDPDPRLLAHATARGWAVLSLRDEEGLE